MKRYNDLNSYLQAQFKTKVYKVALDAGFSCPNQDGTTGNKGCIFCNEGSKAAYINKTLSINEQLNNRIKAIKLKNPSAKFIAYFQAFSGTYAAVDQLEKIYSEALAHPEIVALSVGTRPDCIDEHKIKLLQNYTNNYEIWLEYGLQSSHDKTLKTINRGHSLSDFLQAVTLTKNKGLKICAHIILGLPGETNSQIRETAKLLADLNLDGIKIHLLHVIAGTPLHEMYLNQEIKLLQQEEYVSLVCDILEILPPKMIIHRLTGEADKSVHIAPLWALQKSKVLYAIEQELKQRNSYQGIHYRQIN